MVDSRRVPSAKPGNTNPTVYSVKRVPRAAGPAMHLAFGENVGCAVVEPGQADLTPGSVLCWGDTSAWFGPQERLRDVAPPVVLPGLGNIVEIRGSRSMCARSMQGKVWCFGAQPGSWGTHATEDASPFKISGPKLVSGIEHAVALAVGNTTACVVTNEGTVRCWGDNFQGTVGDGTNQQRTEPVVVDVGFTAVGVALTQYDGCAWDAAGTVACWGRTDGYQPGTQFRTPAVVARIPGMLKLSNQCALMRDHTIQCLQGSTVPSSPKVPAIKLVRIPDVTDAVDINSEDGYTCVLRQTGALNCWATTLGSPLPGERRGPSQTVPHNLPQPTNVVEFAAGTGQICARIADASIVCWGNGSFGQLGDGQATLRDAPEPIVLPANSNQRTLTSAPLRVCKNNEDCNWDRSDAPTACTAHAPEASSQTHQSATNAGTCSCLQNRCTWQHPRDNGVPSADACKGPACECQSGSCTPIDVQAVPCASDQDCWFSPNYPHRPIRRPAKLRGYKFRPCVDGEVEPKCYGTCGFGMPYGC